IPPICHGFRCIYVVPTFFNPTGKVWSPERRKLLLKLAQKYHVVIFEDDPYGDIHFHKDEQILADCCS
ncbi:aminotransferase class I/II-fold pyridoxal phosphate-dependent enzyme, partial [Caldalkalibacillus thermarum]|uniref:aminotransferase class I/II-fold pyridoxal phosphate-dependent enzyme n=1 Tax=Caldalkalibacillus thermarum TaxID=296745 RepID=UPI00307A3341